MNLSSSWEYIEHIAAERLKHNISPRHVSDYGTDIEVIGAAGELAARHFFSMDESLHTYFDGGADLNYRGHRIDVKSTVWTPRVRRRFLQWPHWKRVKAEFVLMTAVSIERREAILLGYATPRMIKDAPVNLTRDYPCHEVPTSELLPASYLLNIHYAGQTKTQAAYR